MQDISMQSPTQSLSRPVCQCQQNETSHMTHNVYQFKHSISASAYVWEKDYLLPHVCTCCVQCVFAQRQRLCQYRHGLCLQVLYVPDPEYVSSVGSSPSLSPISPLSPTSSEADLEKVTVCWPRLMHCPTLRKWPSLLTFTFWHNQRIFSTCIMKWTKWSSEAFVVTYYLIVELRWLKCRWCLHFKSGVEGFVKGALWSSSGQDKCCHPPCAWTCHWAFLNQ